MMIADAHSDGRVIITISTSALGGAALMGALISFAFLSVTPTTIAVLGICGVICFMTAFYHGEKLCRPITLPRDNDDVPNADSVVCDPPPEV